MDAKLQREEYSTISCVSHVLYLMLTIREYVMIEE